MALLSSCNSEKDAPPSELADVMKNALASGEVQHVSTLLLDVIGCIAFGRVSVKPVIEVMLSEIALFQSQQSITADALWFWGTQVKFQCTSPCLHFTSNTAIMCSADTTVGSSL